MTDQITLNQDALETMSREIDPDWWQIIDNYPGDLATPRYRKTALDKAERYARAYLAALPVEYAGLHKHAGLDTKDEDDVEFMSEEHLRETFADYPNCTLMYRPSTQWQELGK